MAFHDVLVVVSSLIEEVVILRKRFACLVKAFFWVLPKRLAKASEYAKKALSVYDPTDEGINNNDDDPDLLLIQKEGLPRVLSVVAACYKKAESAVTAEGLYQSASDAKSVLYPGTTTRLQLRDALRGYSDLCRDWDRREADAKRLLGQAKGGPVTPESNDDGDDVADRRDNRCAWRHGSHERDIAIVFISSERFQVGVPLRVFCCRDGSSFQRDQVHTVTSDPAVMPKRNEKAWRDEQPPILFFRSLIP